jgi:hypothetical protein
LRYLFRGVIKENGSPVEGHVEAATEEAGYNALSQNGVMTESLIPDPKPLNLSEELPQAPQFADALESAFDSSSSQVDFDALTQRYSGKKVWVIDRDKIRRRVAQVVDAALALAAQHAETPDKARARVQSAITAMFNDTRNLATERNADSIAGVRFNADAAPPPPPPLPQMPVGVRVAPYLPNGNGGTNGGAVGGAHGGANGGTALNIAGHAGLENQVARMAQLVKQAESAMAAITAAARRGFGGGGGGGGGGGRRLGKSKGGGEEQNSVLLEIFKSNLALVRGMQDPPPGPGAAAGGPPASGEAPAAEAAPEPVGAGA